MTANMHNKPWLIIPIKQLELSKQRLGEHFNQQQRQSLAKAMLKDMLSSLMQAKNLAKIIIVTKDADVAALCAAANCTTENALDGATANTPCTASLTPGDKASHIPCTTGLVPGDSAFQLPTEITLYQEPETIKDLNSALNYAVNRAGQEGAKKLILMHGDIPLLDAQELDNLIAEFNSEIAIVPDKHGTGTNALLLILPSKLQLQFGESSFTKHKEQAEELQLKYQVLHYESIALDVDSVNDINILKDNVKENTYTGKWFAQLENTPNETVN